MLRYGYRRRTVNEGRSAPENGERNSDHDPSANGMAAWTEALRDFAPYMDLGWRLAGTAAFPPLLGVALDAWFGTSPWILVGGCVVGLVGAVVQLKRLQENFGH